MIESLFKEMSGLLDRRFIVNALLPVTMLAAALTTVAAATHPGIGATVAAFDRQPATVKLLIAVGVATALVVAAAVLSSGTTWLLRLYEGYWTSPPGRLAARVGRGWHRKQLARLARDPAGYELIYRGYPLPTQPEQVMPTRLGNVLRSAETYPRDRYGLDAVVVWPRLYPLLPDQFVIRLAAIRADLELLLVVSAAAAAFAVASGGYLLVARAPWWAFVACLWGGTAVATWTYRGAVGTSVGYAEQVRVAFDLYRQNLLKWLDGSAPAPGEEWRRWQELTAHWYRNVPHGVEETDSPSPPPAATHALMSLAGWWVLIVSLASCAGAVYLAV